VGASIGEIRPSVTLKLDEDLFIVIDCTHIKQANRRASTMARVRNLRSGQTLDITLRDSDNFEIIEVEKRKLQYSYHEGDHYHFMDMETYEDLALDKNRIEEQIPWLKDNITITGLYLGEDLLNLELPMSMELKVIETDPGYRGDTVKQGNKPAKLETGLVVGVPLFINTGDTIKVDTRTKEYIGRM
jgi:elongation factor P